MSSKVEVRPINHERLARWKERLNAEDATPVLLIGIGHNKQAGKVVCLTTEEMSDQSLILFIEKSLRELRGY